MVRVVARKVIPLRPQPLDVRLLRPALERQCPGFDALDDGVAVDQGLLRFADFLVCGLDPAVEDRGGLPFV